VKHLTQQMISTDLRKPFIQKRRRKLQQLLRQPGLSATERDRFRAQLDGLGKPKVYKWDEPQPGAIDPGPMPVVAIELDLDDATFETLSKQPHSRLFLFAQQQGLEIKPGETKAKVINTILAAHQGETQ